MTNSVPDIEVDASALPHRSRIPGVDAIRATAGFQRAMLFIGFAIMTFFVIIALFAPLIAPYGFNDAESGDESFKPLDPPSSHHWFGTTQGRQDVLSQVIYGAQTALEVIILAVVISIVVGVPLGLISGYFGGWLDRVLVLIADALYSFPSLLLAIVINISVFQGSSGKLAGIFAAALSITVVYVPQYFRVVRNATIAAREETYVEAARALGASPRVIMIRYVFGNVVQSVPVIATINAGDAILTLAGLGFLGYGIDQSAGAEWGYELSQAVSPAASGIWWTATYPGIAIVLIVVGVTLVGESLNDVLNPLLRTRKMRQVVLPPREQATPTEARSA